MVEEVEKIKRYPSSSMVRFDRIVAYEAGALPYEQVIELFQELIDSGEAWSLQGHYGRTAMNLVEQGLCTLPNDTLEDKPPAEETEEEPCGALKQSSE